MFTNTTMVFQKSLVLHLSPQEALLLWRAIDPSCNSVAKEVNDELLAFAKEMKVYKYHAG